MGSMRGAGKAAGNTTRKNRLRRFYRRLLAEHSSQSHSGGAAASSMMTCRVEVATRTAPSEMVLDAVGQFPDHIFVPHKIEHAGAILAVGISLGMTYLGRERL